MVEVTVTPSHTDIDLNVTTEDHSVDVFVSTVSACVDVTVEPSLYTIPDALLDARVTALENETDGLVNGVDPLQYYIISRDN